MSTIKLTAKDIAEQQLVAALRLWCQEDYLPAITLAGAAEEILGKLLRELDVEPSFDNIRKSIANFAKLYGDNDPNSLKIISDMLNSTKNELKHYAGGATLEFDLREDAVEILERAISNYTQFTGKTLDEMIPFWADIEGS